jgi:DNA polymerase III delta prime subunit
MIATENQQGHFSEVAENTLQVFADIAASVDADHAQQPPLDATALTPNTFTNPDAVRAVARQNEERDRKYQVLSEEPAIARVVARNERGELETYFISRVPAPNARSHGCRLASSNGPFGRIASLPPGSEFEFSAPAGSRTLEVVERALLHPTRATSVWDSKNTILEGATYGTVTVLSLSALLQRAIEQQDFSAIEALLAEEEERGNVVEGIRRNVITKMALRDQPILDQFQDAIFRLPLNKRLLLLGPPGTGKTTTLIRRLGQKIDLQYLDDDERRLVDAANLATPHDQSWLMFTPTKLLKYYVKEAFAREGVAASDHRIVTWKDYRHALARERFAVLRTGNGGGPFTPSEHARVVEDTARLKESEWFEDFSAWQDAEFWKGLEASASRLASSSDAAVAALGNKLANIIAQRSNSSVSDDYLVIDRLGDEIRQIVSRLKTASDAVLQKSLNVAYNSNKAFIDEFAAQIASVKDVGDDLDEEEVVEDDEPSSPSPTARRQAIQVYNRVIRNRARAEVAGRGIPKSSPTGRLLDWLDDRIPSKDERTALGQNLRIQDSCRAFQNPLSRYLAGVPRRYRQFRNLRQAEGKWYLPSGFGASEITPQEVDTILLTILRTAQQLLRDRKVISSLDGPAFAALSTIKDIFKNQIMVDEATDFSPLELACMGALSNPGIGSFFACGDFNQRITDRGIRSEADVRWSFPDIDVQAIKTTYRHSKQLNELAEAIVHWSSGGSGKAVLPDHVPADAVRPVFGKNLGTLDEKVAWLAKRIVEIERLTKALPSIAILTNSEEQVQPLASALNQALTSYSMPVVACPQGLVVGEDSDIRVFDVQHIKGLEFEAVFFIGIDELAAVKPDLFDKYLYVGATRAATYLGWTSAEDRLPEQIESLATHFGTDWQ